MVTLQRSLQSMSATAPVPFCKPHPLLQQSRTILKRDNLNFNLSQNRKNGSSVPCRSYFPTRRIGRGENSSHVCLASADPPFSPDSSTPAAESGADADDETVSGVEEASKSFWKNWRMNAAELRAKVSKWGLAAVLAYGLFDGITYTTFFVLAFLSYEKSTGNNPATNLKALLGVVVLMWGGNNVTRPFRVAGAAALAPFIDRGLKKMQEVLKLPNQLFAFMICVATFAGACFSVVAVLILSRLGK